MERKIEAGIIGGIEGQGVRKHVHDVGHRFRRQLVNAFEAREIVW